MDQALSIANNRLDRVLLPQLAKTLARMSLDMKSMEGYRIFCEKLESQIAEQVGVHDCLLTNSGTDALQLVLMSMGLKKLDEVIIPASAYAAVGLAVHYAGARVVAVDVEEDTRLMSADLVAEKISRRTKAVIMIHMYGHCCDIGSFQELARSKKVMLIENVCQAFGSRSKGRMVGSFAPMAALSFSYAKTLASLGGNGGAVLLRHRGMKKKIRKCLDVHQGSPDLLSLSRKMPRINFLDALSVALKLRHFDIIEDKKRACTLMYHDRFKDLPQVRFFIDGLHVDSVRPFYLIMAEKRDGLHRFLSRRGIVCEKEYASDDILRKLTGQSIKNFPMAFEMSQRGLRLPLFPLMEPEEASLIAGRIKEFYGQK